MSCPLCGERCTCSDAGAASFLIDPDECDLSEQRFTASLEGAEVAVVSRRALAGIARDEQHEPAWRTVAAITAAPCPTTAKGERMWDTERVRSEPQGGRSEMEDGAIWRQEVASRVESYRVRRRRPLRERSLPLDFERAVNREITSGNLSASREDESEVPSLESSPETDENSIPESQAEERYRFERPQDLKIIEFPRLAMLPVMPPLIEEVAETIIGRPRILDVSEEVETTAPLSDITVAPEAEQRPAVEFELPLQVAPMSQRVFAGMMDALIALVGAAAFVMITLKAGVPVPQAKTGFLVALAAPCLLWAIYEYMFLVYAGTTPGMQLAHLKLITFDGACVRRRTRRGRALAMVLSTLSLGLGLVWALLDEDTLCWHDRITRTYVVAGR